MKTISFQKQIFIFFLLVLQIVAQMTLPLKHGHYASQKKHHLKRAHNGLHIYHTMNNFQKNSHFNLKSSHHSQIHHLTPHGYYFTISINILGLQYNLNIDTGSSDLFIKGQKSPGNPKIKYECAQCMQSNQKITIGYLDGQLQTYKVKEAPIKFGNHSFIQSILVAYTAPKPFEAAQGLMGLSFPQNARNQDPTFIQTLINNKIIKQYSFGVNLNFQKKDRSWITFGEADKNFYQGELVMVKLYSQSSYFIQIDNVIIGNKKINVQNGLLDTGNTCISFGDQFAKDILEQFNRNSENKCGFDIEENTPMFSLLRCKIGDFQKLPSFNIKIRGHDFVVNKDAYMQRCYISNQNIHFCDTYIQSSRGTGFLIGDGFFNRFYTYFDLQQKMIGLAKNKQQLSYKNMYKPYSDVDDADRVFLQTLK